MHDALPVLIQESSVSSQINEYSCAMIAAVNIVEQQKLSRLGTTLRPMIRSWLLRANSVDFMEAVRAALNVSSVMHGAEEFQNSSPFHHSSKTQPIDLRTVES